MKYLLTSLLAGTIACMSAAAAPSAPAHKASRTAKKEINASTRHHVSSRAAGEVIVDETFAKMTAGSPTSPVSIETDDYYCIPASLVSDYGWGGFLLGQAGGQLYVAGGTEDDYGILWTPDLPDGGKYTVTFDVRIPSTEDADDYVVVTFSELDEYEQDETYEGDYDYATIDNQWQTVTFEFESLSADAESVAWMEFYTNDYSDMLIRNVVITYEGDEEGGDTPVIPGDGVVITMADGAAHYGTAVGTWTTQGFTLTADGNGGNNNPVVNGNTGDMRIYAGGTFTVSADVNITSMQFELSQKGQQRIAEIECSTGKIVKQGANPLVWTGSAKSVTFTVGATSIGTEEGKAGQFDFTTITITTDGSTTPDDPDEPGETDIIYTGLVDDADDWEIETIWPEDGSYDPWAWDAKYGLKATGYYSGQAQETEGVAGIWVDLTGYTDCTLTFDHALNYLDLTKYDREWFVDVYAYDETAETEDDLVSLPVTWPTGTNWNYVSSGNIDLSAFEGKWTCIALYYYSGPTETDEDGPNVAGTWEVKNFVITGKNDAGVRDVIYDSSIEGTEYYDLNGVRVANPANGIYIMRQGDKVTKVLVK